MTLGRIMKQCRTQHVGIFKAGLQQSVGDVESMPAVRDRHGLEQRDGAIGQDAARKRVLLGADARPDVGDELTDPMHR